MKKVFNILITFCSLSFFTANSYAGGVYVAKSVQVNEIASSALEAKNIAFLKAKKQAWINLLNDLSLLKTSSLPDLDEKTLNSIIRTIEVSGEKTRGKRYIANIKIYFSPPKVRELFKQRNISYVEERGFPVLVIPVYESAGITHIYDNDNLWEQAIFNSPKSGGLLPIFLATGGTVNSLKIDRFTLKDDNVILSRSRDFGVEGVILSKLSVTAIKSGKKISLNYRAIGGYLSGENDSITMIVGDDEVEKSLLVIVNKFYQSLENMWREKRLENEINGGNEQTLILQTNNLEDWYYLRKQLSEVGFVEKVNLISIQGGLVEVNITFLGIRKKIKNSLNRLGFNVVEKNKVWVVKRPVIKEME